MVYQTTVNKVQNSIFGASKYFSRKVDIKKVFSDIARQKVLVIGDVMIDSYLWGRVERISPEAPVPVVSVSKKEIRPGGAANVAANVQSMGAVPYLFSVVGNDKAAADFISVLRKNKMPLDGILKSRHRSTTVKTRVIGNKHQLLRVDEEIADDISDADNQKFIDHVTNFISKQKPSVIIFEDYDKGLLNEKNITSIISAAHKNNIPVAVDPKKKNFLFYKNVDLFKPNLKELREGLKLDLEKISSVQIKTETEKFRKKNKIKTLLITLSENGIYFGNNTAHEIIPAHIRNISDVSGAGDTVITVAALCLAAGCAAHDIAWLSNLAGGLVCEKVGVVPIDRNLLLEETVKLK